jgi:uncharacterized protein (TIGR03067 family)
MLRPTVAGVVVLAGFTFAAPALKDPPAKPDPLVGVWTLESVAFNGQVRHAPDGLQWEFTADGKCIRHVGTSVAWEKKGEFQYTGNASAKPRTIDLHDRRGKADEKAVTPCICKVEGDWLTIALPRNNRTARPTDFETPSDLDSAVYVFKRVKPKD